MVIAISADMINSLYKHWGMHLFMLKDQIRMNSYQQAIESVIRPSDVVVDIGTGTGILAFLAARAGAKKVYAIERNMEILNLAKELSSINHMCNIVQFIHGDSRNINLPEKADVIISELIGIFAVDENMLPVLLDARNRFLKPDGRIIPSKIDMFVLALESATLFDQTCLNSEDVFGLDFTRASDLTRGTIYAVNCHIPDVRFLSTETLFTSIDLLNFTDCAIVNYSAVHINNSGILHGIAGCWEALLFDGVTLSTNPVSHLYPSHWMNAFFPVKEPFIVSSGEETIFHCYSEIFDDEIDWKYNIESRAL